jgi:acetyl esterase/lipase
MPSDLLDLVPPRADARVSYGPLGLHFGELRIPPTCTRGILMNVHGGFWRNKYDLTHAGHFCNALAVIGFATWNVEYRRVGDDGGGWPGTLDDLRLAWNFIPQLASRYALPNEQIIVAGHSAGGHLALCLAAQEPSVAAVVSLAGVVDLARAWQLHLGADAASEFMGGSPEQVAQHYTSADPMRLSLPQTVQTLIHGGKDDVVPADFSRSYCETKRGRSEDARLIEIADADHFDLIDPRSFAWPQVERAICKSAASAARE